ncbi:MAG: prs, partial [Firmicutes bacterium]|nr:prs [Bacillota bacterium]
AGSLVEGAKALGKMGAKEVYACCTHAILSDPAVDRIKNSNIKELIITNSIPLTPDKECEKIKSLSVAKIFGEGIIRVYTNSSISKLFDRKF